MKSLPELLKEAREEAGLSQRELAAKLGVAQPFIAQLETGVRRPPIQVLYRIANVTNAPHIIGVRSKLPSNIIEWLCSDPEMIDTLVDLHNNRVPVEEVIRVLKSIKL